MTDKSAEDCLEQLLAALGIVWESLNEEERQKCTALTAELEAEREANRKLREEVERLKGEIDEGKVGLCDVEGCDEPSVSGGGIWRDNGYWMLCSNHHRAGWAGEPQPQMKQEAIERESRRDKTTGYLTP